MSSYFDSEELGYFIFMDECEKTNNDNTENRSMNLNATSWECEPPNTANRE